MKNLLWLVLLLLIVGAMALGVGVVYYHVAIPLLNKP